MTRPESRLPGRPDERAASRSPAPGGCADPLLGLVLVLAESVLGALPVLVVAATTLWPPHGPSRGFVDTWGPTLVLAALAVVPAGLAVALLRHRWHWAGGAQVLVAVALCAAALTSAVRERPDPWRDHDPARTVAPSPAWDSPPCRSGGDNDECARSGG
ncbi:hypothetical protein G3I43_23120 [Streptomyces anulatus]|uniref:DUF6234 domain-containing protein n=2 Tax=Streptomyces TaxID=1883 RepID=A0A6G3SVM6_STRAQ|nr:DUF6234 family protein [Streptomyces anulatus]NDZ60583.1 hypothetical protein [Streptomyces anulatus]NEB87044.1 hypothetical protein [Streptomyces anulatus]